MVVGGKMTWLLVVKSINCKCSHSSLFVFNKIASSARLTLSYTVHDIYTNTFDYFEKQFCFVCSKDLKNQIYNRIYVHEFG